MKNKYELFNEIELNDQLKEEYPLSDKEKDNLYNKLVKDIKRDANVDDASYDKNELNRYKDYKKLLKK